MWTRSTMYAPAKTNRINMLQTVWCECFVFRALTPEPNPGLFKSLVRCVFRPCKLTSTFISPCFAFIHHVHFYPRFTFLLQLQSSFWLESITHGSLCKHLRIKLIPDKVCLETTFDFMLLPISVSCIISCVFSSNLFFDGLCV